MPKFRSFKALAVYKLGKCPACELRPKKVGEELCEECDLKSKEAECHALTQQ